MQLLIFPDRGTEQAIKVQQQSQHAGLEKGNGYNPNRLVKNQAKTFVECTVIQECCEDIIFDIYMNCLNFQIFL